MNNNNIEIERKYLVDFEKFSSKENKVKLVNTTRILQGYFSADSSVRVRVAYSQTPRTQKAFITYKGKGTVSRQEIECEIPYDKGHAMYEMVPLKIEKTRLFVKHTTGLIWEVDCFKGSLSGLVLAELELNSEDDQIDLPDWIVREVTEDSGYSNASLACKGLPNSTGTML